MSLGDVAAAYNGSYLDWALDALRKDLERGYSLDQALSDSLAASGRLRSRAERLGETVTVALLDQHIAAYKAAAVQLRSEGLS